LYAIRKRGFFLPSLELPMSYVFELVLYFSLRFVPVSPPVP
jgi:hypothetical protein